MKNNWQTKKLGDENILKMTSGGTPSRSNSGFYNGDILWLKSGELNDNENILGSEEKITEDAIKNSSAKIFPKGTVLFAMYGATAGKIGILGVEATTNQAVAGMIPNEEVLYNRYLYYFLIHERTEIISRAWGGAQPNLSQTILKEIKIPLPPLPEQKEIVKMLDEKMGKIAEAKRLRAEALVDTEKILPQTLREIFDEGKGFGWEEKEIQDVCEHPQYGFTASSSREPVGPKMLRITDIQDGGVDWDGVPYCKCDSAEKYELSKGDLVFARTGATVGKSFLIADVPKRTIYASYLIRLRAKENILPEFLYYFFQSPDYWGQISDGQVGAAQPNVNGSKLGKLKLFVPPIAEQQKIVAKLDTLSKKVRALRDLETTQLADLKSLERAHLREAFAGRNFSLD